MDFSAMDFSAMDFSAMDFLKGMNFRSLFRFLDSKDDDQFISWLQSVGLLHSFRTCSHCAKPMSFYKCPDNRTDNGNGNKFTLFCRCSNSRKCPKRPKVGFYNGSFFEEHKLSLKEIFIFSYYWAHGMASEKTIEREFRRANGTTLSSQTNSLYRKLVLSACVEYYLRNPGRIGGPNVVVKVDESCVLSKRKHNLGRLPIDMQSKSKQWYFGGVVRGQATNCFIIPIPDQTSATLCSAIARYIVPGSVIMHDGLVSYQAIDRMKALHEHYEVLHKYNFVSPDNPEVPTQTIESTWGKFKQANRQRGGTSRHLFMNFLSEYIWRKNHEGPDCLFYLWKHISEVFVSVNGEITIHQIIDSVWEYDVFEV